MLAEEGVCFAAFVAALFAFLGLVLIVRLGSGSRASGRDVKDRYRIDIAVCALKCVSTIKAARSIHFRLHKDPVVSASIIVHDREILNDVESNGRAAAHISSSRSEFERLADYSFVAAVVFPRSGLDVVLRQLGDVATEVHDASLLLAHAAADPEAAKHHNVDVRKAKMAAFEQRDHDLISNKLTQIEKSLRTKLKLS